MEWAEKNTLEIIDVTSTQKTQLLSFCPSFSKTLLCWLYQGQITIYLLIILVKYTKLYLAPDCSKSSLETPLFCYWVKCKRNAWLNTQKQINFVFPYCATVEKILGDFVVMLKVFVFNFKNSLWMHTVQTLRCWPNRMKSKTTKSCM